MTLLMGSMSCQNSLKMHFCSCDSGMSLILEVDVAGATETYISRKPITSLTYVKADLACGEGTLKVFYCICISAKQMQLSLLHRMSQWCGWLCYLFSPLSLQLPFRMFRSFPVTRQFYISSSTLLHFGL